MNGERGFALKLPRIGQVFICVRYCLYHISHSVRTALDEVNVNVHEKVPGNPSAAEVLPTGQRQMNLGSAKQCQPSPRSSGSEGIVTPSPSGPVLFFSPIWLIVHALSLPEVLSK